MSDTALPRHVALLGLMGAGKSTIGGALAARLGRAISDSDVEITAATGLSARELKARLGVEELHRLEAEHLLGALNDEAPSVVCAAASAIDEPRCRQALTAPDVFSVWLKAPPELLGARFASGGHRPAYGEDPAQFMAAQLQARGRWFAEVADLQLDPLNRTPSEIVDEIVRIGSMRDEMVRSPFYRVSVKALVFDGDDRLLVVQEPGGTWECAGGGWEHGETLDQCLNRELHEELDVGLASVDLSTLHASTGPGPRRHYQRLKLSVRATLDSMDVAPGDGILATRWVTREQYRRLGIPVGDTELREHVLRIWPGTS